MEERVRVKGGGRRRKGNEMQRWGVKISGGERGQGSRGRIKKRNAGRRGKARKEKEITWRRRKGKRNL